MKNERSIVPVYPTVPFSGFVARGSSEWERTFPFSSSTGVWTFSGRVALYLGLPVLNLPPKSTILVPSYFQGVEIDTLLAAGHKLRFYRIDERFTVDLDDAERRLDSDVSAFYIIHYFGFPQPLAPIIRFCEQHGLKLIEDCALSLFSRDDRGWLGTEGDLALYSVYKTLALPHGGFLVTKNKKASGALRPAPFRSTLLQTKDLIHQHMKASGWGRLERWILTVTGLARRTLGWSRKETISSGIAHWDPRMLEFGASSWVVRLMRLADPETVIATRRRNYAHLASRLLGKIPTPPPFDQLPEGVCPLFYPVTVDDKIRFQADLASLDIQTVNLWYEPHPACPPDLAQEVSGWRKHLLELPIHHGLSPTDVDRVADAVLHVLGKG